MAEFSSEEKTILVQYGIKKYENEETIFEKLKTILSEKDIQRNIDTLLGTQLVRRIGPENLQNNESHTELPDLPEHLKSIIDDL
jgi:signal recognition particle GTPase